MATDPLLALRLAIKSKSEITYANDSQPSSNLAGATHLVLSPAVTFLKSTPTRYRKPGVSTSTDPATNPQDFFSLEAVYLAWHLKNAPGAEYMKQARESGLAVGFVSVTERQSVVDWLEERITDHESIFPVAGTVSTTPPGSPRRDNTASPSKSHAAYSKATAAAEPSSLKRRYVPDSHDVEIVKKIKQQEIELRDRNTVLQGTKPNNFSALRTTYAEKLKKLKEVSKSGPVTPASTHLPDVRPARKRNMHPIIIISSSPTALITMYNVKRFLQESSFEPSLAARERAAAEGNTRPEDLIPVYRKRTTIDSSGKEIVTQTRYMVVDSIEALNKMGSDSWDRVVCVMTTGQAWQFRPYKWTEPRQLFHNVKGFYVAWANDPPNTKIKDWNVTELKIDQNRRHVDKAVVAEFWKTLDAWTTVNKPSLMR